jgi:hypothetical protein
MDEIPLYENASHVLHTHIPVYLHFVSAITPVMTNQDNEKVYFSVVLVPLTLGFLVCGYRFFVKGWADEFHQVVPVTGATSFNVVASDDGPSSSAPSVEAMEANRKEVLKTMFPVSDGRNEGTRMLLAYDVGSKKYIRQNSTESNVVASPSCSICLEGFGAYTCVNVHLV